MNYVREINAFYDQQEINPLSVSAIALWHALMHICNKAGWPENFSVAVSVLSIKSGLKERTVYLARNELKQKGYIIFQSKKGNQSATYNINSLSVYRAGMMTNNHEENDLSATHADTYTGNGEISHANSLASTHAALIKQNKMKQKEQENDHEHLNPFHFYEMNGFGTLSPIVSEDINHWLQDSSFEEPELIITEAMKQAVINNARSWKYVTRILSDWSNRKLQTLQDVHAYQTQWKKGHPNVAKFQPKAKGKNRNDADQRHAQTDYSKYDFGF